MTFIGASIILATFVVKDIMSEKLREVNDSLGAAETFYLSQTYSIFIQDDLVYIKQEVDRALSVLQTRDRDHLEANEKLLSVSSKAGIDHLNVVIEYVRNLASLTDKLPQEADKTGQAKMLLVECAELSNEMQSLQNRIPGLFSAIKLNPKDRHAFEELTEFIAETNPIPAKTQSIMDRAKKLTEYVVSDLASKKKESERHYKWTKIIANVLFALGWATGLAGQLLGLNSQTES